MERREKNVFYAIGQFKKFKGLPFKEQCKMKYKLVAANQDSKTQWDKDLWRFQYAGAMFQKVLA